MALSRKQCVKVGVDFSAWKNIYKSVPQGSILGPVLLNIFLNDIFNFVEESILYNYADFLIFFNFSGIGLTTEMRNIWTIIKITHYKSKIYT
jgi:retron-type reverse transcriptase